MRSTTQPFQNLTASFRALMGMSRVKSSFDDSTANVSAGSLAHCLTRPRSDKIAVAELKRQPFDPDVAPLDVDPKR